MVLLLSGWENINKKFTKQQVLLRGKCDGSYGGVAQRKNKAGFMPRGCRLIWDNRVQKPALLAWCNWFSGCLHESCKGSLKTIYTL